MAKFKLGKLAATTAVADKMQNDRAFAAFVSKSIRRYENQDWGDSPDEDKLQNDYAVENGERIFATYKQDMAIHDRKIIWIITEWDRSATTILFPEEY
jgi:hypothetical protein